MDAATLPPVSPPPPPALPPEHAGASSPSPRPPDPSRSGTMWLGATGVAMLLAAAAVLTIVRWNDIGQSIKLGGLVAVTGAVLAGGRRMQVALPLTGRILFHFGALLVPFDIATIAVLANRPWPATLLFTSLSAMVAWSALAQLDRSPVLIWATWATVPALAAGVAASSAASAPLVLAVVAALALAGGSGVVTARHVGGWAAIAGAWPLATVEWPTRAASVLQELGLGADHRGQLIGATLIAALSAAELTRRRPSVERAWLTIAVSALGAVGLFGLGATALAPVVVAALFVTLELVALSLRDDKAWKPIVGPIAKAGEAVAALLTVWALLGAWAEEWVTHSDPDPATMLGYAIGGVLTGLGWLAADRRRVLAPVDWLVATIYGSGWWPTTVMAPIAALTVASGLRLDDAGHVAVLVATTGWAVLTARPGGWTIGVAALLALPALDGGTRISLALTLAALFCLETRLHQGALGSVPPTGRPASATRFDDSGPPPASTLAPPTGPRLPAPQSNSASDLWPMLAAAVAIVMTADPAHGLVGDWALPLVVALGWALRWAVLAGPREERLASLVGPGLAVAVVALSLPDLIAAPITLATALGVAVLAGYEFDRRGTLGLAVLAGFAGALALVPAGQLLELSVPATGVVSTAVAVLAVGVAAAVPIRFEPLAASLALSTTAVGLVLALASEATMAPAICLAGLAIALGGAVRHTLSLAGSGMVVVMLGWWMQLAVWQIGWLEAYLAIPVALAIVAGVGWHRNGVASWSAFAPPIVVFAGASILQRLEGGSAWHSVIAGAVGIAAVIAGSSWRLLGPLLAGTGTLAVVVGYELVGPAGQVPTWGWLALGGTVLVGSAVAMERRETTPLEQGHRLVEVLGTRYS